MSIYALFALVVLVNAQHFEIPSKDQKWLEKNEVNVTAVVANIDNFEKSTSINITSFQLEVSNAQNSTYGEVFKKYFCAKSAQLKTWYHKFLSTAINTSVADQYQHLITNATQVADNALDYVCANNGTVITSLFTTESQECFESKEDEINICVLNFTNTTMNITLALLDHSPIVQWYDTFVRCVVENLEKCVIQTPSQVIANFGKILREGVVEVSQPNGTYTANIDNFEKFTSINITSFKLELSNAQNSTYGEVFKKYFCAKSAQLKTRYHEFLNTAINTFVADQYQHLITTATQVADNALDYVCANNGTVITSLFTTESQECFKSKEDEINICVSNFTNTTMNITLALLDHSPIVQWYDTFVQCVVENLEKCVIQTPSQVIANFGKILREGVVEVSQPNGTYTLNEEVKDAASGLAVSSAFFGLVLFAFIYNYI